MQQPTIAVQVRPCVADGQRFPHSAEYRNETHRALPHIVKLSGGRSSAMMLETLIDDGALDARRGDVVVFNNTAAEHRHTYGFVEQMLGAAHRAAIPAFITEFVTYEDAVRGMWTRIAGQRIARPRRRERARGGYERAGEVYEELLSWSGFLPNRFARSCTRHLKIDVTTRFVREWMRGETSTRRQGHFGSTPRLTLDDALRRHRKAGGRLSRKALGRVRAFVWNRPFSHERQPYEDASPIECRAPGVYVARDAPGFVTLVGLRADEPARLERTIAQCEPNAPEQTYAPLGERGATRRDVERHWRGRHDDLRIDPRTNGSNCVFCFMKAEDTLAALAAGWDAKARPLTPEDPAWWTRMEAKYGAGRSTFMGTGARAMGFEAVLAGARSAEERGDMPCACTD